MNNVQLEYLVEAVKHRSFTRAASSLMISPQAVSKAVRDLEAELKVELFHKNGNSVQPTDFAVVFASRASDVLTEFDDLRKLAVLGAASNEAAGELLLMLGSSPYRGSLFPSEGLEAMRNHFPQLNVTMLTSPSSNCLAAVEEGAAQMAIVLGRVQAKDSHCVKLYDLRPEVLMSESNYLANAEELRLSDLNSVRVAFPIDMRFSYHQIQGKLTEAGCMAELVPIEPFLNDYREFLNSGGTIFVTPYFDEASRLFPCCKSLPICREDSLSMPVCLVVRDEADAGVAKSVASFLFRWTTKAIKQEIC